MRTPATVWVVDEFIDRISEKSLKEAGKVWLDGTMPMYPHCFPVEAQAIKFVLNRAADKIMTAETKVVLAGKALARERAKLKNLQQKYGVTAKND